jgi:acetyl-CoA C-acetyltransferase
LSIDPRAPAVVGVGTVTQRDPSDGATAVELMVAAVEAAARERGARELARRASLVLVPRGTWTDPDPARSVVERIGARGALTVLGEIGVLQQTLITRACSAVAEGKAEAVVICGGEDKNRARQAGRGGAPVGPGTPASSARQPDEVLAPEGPLMPRLEAERHLAVPARQYAVIESALAHEDGLSPAESRREIAGMWASFAEVAASSAEAWDRSRPSPDEIATAGPANRMVSAPYTKLMCSQWNVDQAGAILVASVGAALDAGVARGDLVFPVSASESNHVTPLSRRRLLGRWPSFASTARKALSDAGAGLDDLGLIDLYSCFPSAVRVQARELGLPAGRQLTLTGGMTFGGGPLNNYVLQSTSAMVRHLRDGRAGTGLVTTVSGLLSKPAAAVWSSEPPQHGYRSADTTRQDAARADEMPLSPDATGRARVHGCTVPFERGEPLLAVAVLELADGSRTVASCEDPETIASMLEEDWVGRQVSITEPGRFR